MLKLALTTPPIFIFMDYNESVDDIILVVDTSLDGWRGVLMQLLKQKRHPSRYKSEIWSNNEKNYNTTK